MKGLDALAASVCALERTDRSVYQRKARILQSLWRIERGYAAGYHRGRPLGSRLPMPWAERSLANFLTDTVRDIVRSEILDGVKSRGKVFARPRLFCDLLSSQPMVLNLFAPLRGDLAAASRVFSRMTEGRCERVTGIEFEYSPGRGSPRYTADRSAFDVYVSFTGPRGGRGFIGIEAKYHESLSGAPARHRPRYDEVAREMACFRPSHLPRLRDRPLQQIWRDHLLSGAHKLADGFDDALFVLLSPRDNEACAAAARDYADCLSVRDSFGCWTLETFVEALEGAVSPAVVSAFYDRYLAFGKIDERLRDPA